MKRPGRPLLFAIVIFIAAFWAYLATLLAYHSPPSYTIRSSCRRPPQPPPTRLDNAERIIATTEPTIQRSRDIRNTLVGTTSPANASFENVLLVLAELENRRAFDTQFLEVCQDVFPNQQIREACSAAQKKLDDWDGECGTDEDLFALVAAVVAKNETLDPESERLLQSEHRHFKRSGLGVPVGPARDHFKAIQQRLTELHIGFEETFNADHGAWFPLADLNGIPDDTLSRLRVGEGENHGKVWLPFQDPELTTALRSVKGADTRKAIYVGSRNIGGTENADKFQKILVLRDEVARLLGYRNHTELRMEDNMAESLTLVQNWLKNLIRTYKPAAAQEISHLAMLKETSGKSEGTIDVWDRLFYEELSRKADFSSDQDVVAEYFPLSHVIDGMHRMFGEIFGLVFTETPQDCQGLLSDTGSGDDLVWHEDARLFSVWDDAEAGGGFVGYLYLDLFPRHGKYGYAANYNLRPGFRKEDDTRSYPATVIVCNFNRPTQEKPSLLRHDELETLFHELGHAINDLVSRTRYARFHGTNTPRDFVEVASQMLENWAWTPSVLKSLSKHFSYLSSGHHDAGDSRPPEVLPDHLIESIIESRYAHSALDTLVQLAYSLFDLTVHSTTEHEVIVNMAVSDTFNRIQTETTGMTGLDEIAPVIHGETSLDHFVDGYGGAYYGYFW